MLSEQPGFRVHGAAATAFVLVLVLVLVPRPLIIPIHEDEDEKNKITCNSRTIAMAAAPQEPFFPSAIAEKAWAIRL